MIVYNKNCVISRYKEIFMKKKLVAFKLIALVVILVMRSAFIVACTQQQYDPHQRGKRTRSRPTALVNYGTDRVLWTR